MPVLDDRPAKRPLSGTLKASRPCFGSMRQVIPSQFEGFIRADWEALSAELSANDLPAAQIDWDSLPAWRPGCGSKHLDPSVYRQTAR